MDRELEVIRDDMEHTRASLADKLGALENQVRETVSSASETVTSTVEGVKDVVSSVTETVGSVTDSLNVSKQVEQHPWAAVGIALAAGFVAGQFLGGSRSSHPAPAPYTPTPPAPQPSHGQSTYSPPAYTPPSPSASTSAAQDSSPSLMSQAASMLPSLEGLMPEVKDACNTVVSSVGGMAVGSLMSFVRDMVVKGLPDEWHGDLSSMVEQVNRQLGGKALRPLAKEESGSQPSSQATAGHQNDSSAKTGQQNDDAARNRRGSRGQLAGTT